MKRVGRIVLVLFGFAAVVWIARVVVDLIYGVPGISMTVFLLDVVAAIVWVTAFVVQFFWYRARKKDK